MRNRFPKAGLSLRDSPCSHYQEIYKQAKLQNCHIYVEGLSWSHAESLVVSSDSVSSDEPLAILAGTILPFSQQDSLTNVWSWVKFYEARHKCKYPFLPTLLAHKDGNICLSVYMQKACTILEVGHAINFIYNLYYKVNM